MELSNRDARLMHVFEEWKDVREHLEAGMAQRALEYGWSADYPLSLSDLIVLDDHVWAEFVMDSIDGRTIAHREPVSDLDQAAMRAQAQVPKGGGVAL